MRRRRHHQLQRFERIPLRPPIVSLQRRIRRRIRCKQPRVQLHERQPRQRHRQRRSAQLQILPARPHPRRVRDQRPAHQLQIQKQQVGVAETHRRSRAQHQSAAPTPPLQPTARGHQSAAQNYQRHRPRERQQQMLQPAVEGLERKRK